MVAEGRMRGVFAGSDAIKYLTALGEGCKKETAISRAVLTEHGRRTRPFFKVQTEGR